MIEYKVKVYDSKTIWFNLNNQLHRESGPAIEWSDGSKSWYLNGQLHREDGPALEYVNGSKAWWVNDKLHRESGPAIEWSDGSKFWYLNGKRLTEAEFNQRTKPSCSGKVVEIDGKKYKLTEV
jgi:hypothetical protein